MENDTVGIAPQRCNDCVLTIGAGYATFANALAEEVSDLAERPD
jgi:hypothetical protein